MNKHSFDRWIFESFQVSVGGLALLRITVSLYILIFLIPGNGSAHYSFLAGVPDDFFNPPPGPMQLFSGFPPETVFAALRILLIFMLIALLAGWHTAKVSVCAGLLILLMQGFIYSIGKVNHEILVGFVPIIMAWSGWGAGYSVDSRLNHKKSVVSSWPITLLGILIAFMMFTAGFPKILGGWLDASSQAAQGHLLNQYFVRGRQDLLANVFIHFDSVAFWELLDWLTVLFEIGFLAAVFSPKVFKWFLGFAVVFHFSTMMMLNIAFLPNFLAYAVFLNWEEIYQRGKSLLRLNRDESNWLFPVVFTLILALLFASLRFISLSQRTLTDSDLTLHEVVIVSAAFCFVLFVGVKKLIGVTNIKFMETGKNTP